MASNDELFELMTKMYSEMTDMKSDISNLNKKVDKNSLLLEKVDNNVKTLAEVQSAF